MKNSLACVVPDHHRYCALCAVLVKLLDGDTSWAQAPLLDGISAAFATVL
jgi:hypothetical protein